MVLSGPTKTGTRKLSDVARHVVVPEGIVTTGYPSVRDKCRSFGVVHEDWQQGLGRLILGKRKNGKYAATVGGVVLSTPRQVGKTFIIGTILIALCLLFPRLTVLWTAHRVRTSNETFNAMKAMTAKAKVRPYMLPPRSVNGEQEIRFRNGSRIMFGAREVGFGRGFAEVDVEVFDEAQILTEKALEDMVAATNQSRQAAGALLFYMGTPPRLADPGEVFTNKRARALAGHSKDTVYVELSADPDADPDDRAQILKANPLVPDRTPWESMYRLRENLPSVESFLLEGLGIWNDDTTSLFNMARWSNDLIDRDSAIAGQVWLGLEVARDLSWACISAAGKRSDGFWHVQVAESRPGTAWVAGVAPTMPGIEKGLGVAPTSMTGSLLEELNAAKIKTNPVTLTEYAQSCGSFYRKYKQGELRHLGQPEFDTAVRTAKRRNAGDSWVFDRRVPGIDITPLAAGAIALRMAETGNPRNASRGRVIAT